MFDIFHSTSNEIPKQEFELCVSILKKKPGVFITANSEAERQNKIHNLDLDFFICGWSRYDIDKYVNFKLCQLEGLPKETPCIMDGDKSVIPSNALVTP